MFTQTELLVIFGTSLICAILAYGMVNLSRKSFSGAPDDGSDPMSFLFDDGVLHHATQNALTSFALLPGAHVWDDLRSSLLSRFPQFPETATCQSIGSMTVLPQSPDDPGLLTLHWRDTLCWVELTDTKTNNEQPQDPIESEQTPRKSSDTSPHPSWETLSSGSVGWRNPAYDALLLTCKHGKDDVIFQTSANEGSDRIPLKTTSDKTEWFERISHKMADGMIHHATSVTHLLQAEDAQRTFVQTLAKTFAQLPIGLAIFDRNGQLSIFNPALVDLSGLGPECLAGRPTILSFFDALRENRRMPEPKNYNTWRKEIAAMIVAASDGKYHETWTLEDGRTYTVQGRPHPDGATAFLIEDISAEVTLTRNFRAEVDQYEALLNTLDDALVVFSSSGVVTYSNSAYHLMWGQNPEAAFADMTIQDAINVWKTKGDAAWTKISDFIRTLGNKTELDLTITLNARGKISARLIQIGSDATLIRFSSTKNKVNAPLSLKD